MASPSAEHPHVPEPVVHAIIAWLDDHDRVAPGLIEGLYVVGSVALGDWWPGSDVDVVAFTADPATDADVDLLATAHAEFTRRGLATTVDGPILAWGDVSVPPMPVMRPWTLDGRLHHDGDCFEINPVTWFTLATHGIAARGAPADRLGVHLDRAERSSFVRENVDTYWRGVADQLADVLGDPDRTELPAEAIVWTALGAARMLYTHRTGDVASKSVAGEWAAAEMPHHAAALEQAVEIRRSGRDVVAVGRPAADATLAFVRDVVAEITRR